MGEVAVLHTLTAEGKHDYIGKFLIGMTETDQGTVPYLRFDEYVQNYRGSFTPTSSSVEKSFLELVFAFSGHVEPKELELFGKACVKAAKDSRKRSLSGLSPHSGAKFVEKELFSLDNPGNTGK